MVSTNDYVWYAGFGSNLLRARLLAYLTGGTVRRSSDLQGEAGARDPSEPVASDHMWVHRPLLFAGTSKRWDGGGVAFLGPERADARAICRLYKVTLGQFEDIAKQENRSEQLARVDLGSLIRVGQAEIYDSRYGLIVYLGRHADGARILTITTAQAPAINAPAAGYLATLAEGLGEFSTLTHDEIVDYLLGCPGVRPEWAAEQVSTLLRT